jgi:hypothetical protein
MKTVTVVGNSAEKINIIRGNGKNLLGNPDRGVIKMEQKDLFNS